MSLRTVPPLVSIAFAVALAGLLSAAEIKPIELLKNGGFEEVGKEGLPDGWEVSNAGKLAVATEARTGARAGRFESVEHPWGYCALAAARVPVTPKATFRLSIWARGKGEICMSVYQSSAAGFVGTRFLKPRLVLKPEWQQLTATYRTEDTRVRSGVLAVQLSGRSSVVWLDDASFSFNPEENPGVSVDTDRPATRKIELGVSARDAGVKLFVNGAEVPIHNGAAATEIKEGLVPVAVLATATGAAPAVSVRIVGHSETDGRWRMSAVEQSGWKTTEFDDKGWQAAPLDAEKMVRGKAGASFCLRQVILWNRLHYGPDRCIIPPVKEWGFPRGSMETFHLALYSPLPRRLDDYEFILEVPEAFTILNKTDYRRRHILNNPASKLTAEPIARDGLKYTRYRMSFSAGDVAPQQTQYSLIPVKMASAFAGDACRFYFHRQARGNFTELEQSLPVKILPEINGRRPKKILISQYNPVGSSTASKEHLDERIRQDVAAGCNAYMLSFVPGWGEIWRDYTKLFHDTAIAAGAQTVVWMNYPLNYGGTDRGHLAWYPDWLQAHPEAHGMYYQNTPAWGATPYRSPFCNQFVISDEGRPFWDIVKKEYARSLEHYPKATLFFSDWEFHNVTKDGGGVHCFCPRCKTAFRQFARLPATADLTDEAIMKQHRKQWLAFRDWQDGEIQGRIAKVARELGRQYMTYSWAANDGFWEACKGKVDVAFVGMPGNSVADRNLQGMLDGYATDFRKRSGLRRAIGQRFVFFSDTTKNGWRAMVLSDDGFVHPPSWKMQVLRVVAALQGGIDLQSSHELVGGIRYYLGEATRILSEFEPIFWNGERADALATCDRLSYPDVLVLRLGAERLVLLFNETDAAKSVVLRNRDLTPGQAAAVFGTSLRTDSPAEMRVTVPADDVAVVHIQ